MSEENKRLSGPDLIRAFAAFSVVGVHFFLNCGYYTTAMQGTKMYIMSLTRWFFLICVPLYMLLTGYFKSNKTISRSHYLSLVPILTAYVLITIIKIFVSNHFYGKIYFLKDSIQKIANYNFAWYVGMYICMILLIPFLNILWKALPSKKEKLILIFSLTFISSLYPVVLYIAPSYWQSLYPILYYFIGVYIREYRPRPDKRILLLVCALMVVINATVSYFGAKGGNFNWLTLGGVDSGYSGFTVLVCALSFFLIFYDTDIKNPHLKALLKSISEVSFEIYMFTGCFDAVIYSIAFRYTNGPDAIKFFWLFFAFVPLNFILSYLSSRIFRFFYRLAEKKIISLYNRRIR